MSFLRRLIGSGGSGGSSSGDGGSGDGDRPPSAGGSAPGGDAASTSKSANADEIRNRRAEMLARLEQQRLTSPPSEASPAGASASGTSALSAPSAASGGDVKPVSPALVAASAPAASTQAHGQVQGPPRATAALSIPVAAATSASSGGSGPNSFRAGSSALASSPGSVGSGIVPPAAASAARASPVPAGGSVSREDDGGEKRVKGSAWPWVGEMLVKLFRIVPPNMDASTSARAPVTRECTELSAVSADIQSTVSQMPLPAIVDNFLLPLMMQIMGNGGSPLEYLLWSYEQCGKQIELERVLDKQNAAQLRECCDILCRYSWTLLSETDLFADAKYEQYEGVMQLFPVVLQTSSSEQARAFVASVLSNGGDAVATVVQPIFDRLSRRIATMQMTEPAFMQYMNTVALLTRTRLTPGNEVQVACSTLPSWTPGDANGALLERASFLGPLFRHTTLPDANVEGAKALMLEYFVPAIAERQPVDSHIASLQQTLAGANRVAFTVVRQMLGQQTRDRTLDWFAQVLNANADRAKMYTRNEKVLSSEAFLTNVALSLMELCGPLLTLDSKALEMLNGVDSAYVLSRRARVDFGAAERLVSTEREVSDMRAARASSAAVAAGETEFKPICELFFMAMRALSLGYARTWNKYTSLVSDLSRMAEASRASPEGEKQFAEMLAIKCCCDVHLLEPSLVHRTLTMLDIFPEYPSAAYSVIPESFLEMIIDYMFFIARFSSDTLGTATLSMRYIMTLFVDLMPRPAFVKNPHYRARMAEVMHALRDAGAPAMPLFDSHQAVRERLASSLMRMFVDMEHTGADHQFYDKFSIRYHIGYVMEQLWMTEHYRNQIKADSRNESVWLGFCNMMFNDLIYLLDEALSRLAEIRDIEVLQGERSRWEALSEEERRDKDAKLQQITRHATACLQLGNTMLHLMGTLSEEIADAFCTEKLVMRCAEMCDYYLVELVGPKCTSLRVKDPEKYNFRPRQMLSDLLRIFGNLSRNGNFVSAVARDDRSYSDAVLRRSIGIVKQRDLLTADECAALERFADAVKRAKESVVDLDELLGEPPEEFCDAITYCLMRDPVQLPTGVVVDREAIERHLLSDPSDPFTRAPLSPDDLKPMPDLKARIEAWIAERLASARPSASAGPSSSA